MKRFFILLLVAGFLFGSHAQAEEEATASQTLKSFSAWSIVHYRDYGGNWEEMWNGWLNDPAVPERIKARGIQDREEIRQNMESMRERIASFREEAAESGKKALEQGKGWLEDLKKRTKEEIDSALDNAIRGE